MKLLPKPACNDHSSDDGPVYPDTDHEQTVRQDTKITRKSHGMVFVQGSFANGATKRIFLDHGYSIVNNIYAADIVVWTGGEDINPKLYGEKPIPGTYFDEERDKDDVSALMKIKNTGKFLVGICRGAQLLNVIPNNGKLWQDVDNHGSCLHSIKDCITGQDILVNSVHHQMMKLGPKAELVAFTARSTVKEAYQDRWHCDDAWDSDLAKDPEVIYYPDTKSLLVQFHPEFGHKPTTDYFMSLMTRYWLAS